MERAGGASDEEVLADGGAGGILRSGLRDEAPGPGGNMDDRAVCGSGGNGVEEGGKIVVKAVTRAPWSRTLI